MTNFRKTSLLTLLVAVLCFGLQSCSKTDVTADKLPNVEVEVNAQTEANLLEKFIALASMSESELNDLKSLPLTCEDFAELGPTCEDPGFSCKTSYIAWCNIYDAANEWCPDQNAKGALLNLQDAICAIFDVPCFGEVKGLFGNDDGELPPPPFCN